jgi:putative oxidoreductase
MTKRGFLGVEDCCEFHTISLGCILQRLFSTFPNGWPGFGLLLLRLGVGIALIFLGINDFLRALGEPITIARDLIAAAGGIFLLAGLWTPLTGSVLAVDQLWTAFSQHFSQLGSQWIHILLAVLSAAVAMLGPGAVSVDARLFGRKRFDIGGGGRKPFH